MTLFSFSIPHHFISFQPIRTHGWFVADTFLLLTRKSLIILQSFLTPVRHWSWVLGHICTLLSVHLYLTLIHWPYVLYSFLTRTVHYVREIGVKSHVESYQRLKKWYLIPPCLTLSIIRYVSRVKWIKSRKGVASYPTPRCSSYWKGALRLPSPTVFNFSYF